MQNRSYAHLYSLNYLRSAIERAFGGNILAGSLYQKTHLYYGFKETQYVRPPSVLTAEQTADDPMH